MFIVNSPEERLRLAHASLKKFLKEEYRKVANGKQGSIAQVKDIPEILRPKVFKQEVYDRGMFTNDWFSHNIPYLYYALEKSGKKFSNYLEIGSFEGLSTCWMARLLEMQSDNPTITAIDFFGRSKVQGDFGKRFDKNIKNFIRNLETNKIKSHSAKALSELFMDKKEFDLIYIDGAHDALNVIVDASFCWRMLSEEGVIVFDDYFWFRNKESKDVLSAVNAFLDLIEGKFKVLNVSHQVILQKLKDRLPSKIF